MVSSEPTELHSLCRPEPLEPHPLSSLTVFYNETFPRSFVNQKVSMCLCSSVLDLLPMKETENVHTSASAVSSCGHFYLHEFDLPLSLSHCGRVPLLQLLHPLLQLPAPQLGLLLLPATPPQILLQRKQLNGPQNRYEPYDNATANSCSESGITKQIKNHSHLFACFMFLFNLTHS